MSKADYCMSLAATAGSDNHYAMLSLSHSDRQAMSAILAFFKTTESILYQVREESVARQKLLWWQQEMNDTLKGRATHPISQLLYTLHQSRNINFQALQTYLDYLLSLFDYCQFNDFPEVITHILKTTGCREELIVNSLSLTVPAEALQAFSLCLGITEQLQHARLYLEKSFCFFSQQDLAQFNIPHSMLRTFKTTSELSAFFRELHIRAQAAYTSGTLTSTTKEMTATLQPLIVRCQLALKWLDAIKKDGYPALEQRSQLTPLRKWYIYQKTSRTLTKGCLP